MARKSLRDAIVALVPLFAGLALMAVSIFDSRDDAFSSGRAPVFAAGCAFFFAGVAIAAKRIPDRRWRKLVQATAGTLLLGGFAVVTLAVMLAPSLSKENVWERRIVGAVATLATLGVTCLGFVGIYRALRSFRTKVDTPDHQP